MQRVLLQPFGSTWGKGIPKAFSIVPDQELAHQVLIRCISQTQFIFHRGSQPCKILVNIATSFFFFFPMETATSKKNKTLKKKKDKLQHHQNQSVHCNYQKIERGEGGETLMNELHVSRDIRGCEVHGRRARAPLLLVRLPSTHHAAAAFQMPLQLLPRAVINSAIIYVNVC